MAAKVSLLLARSATLAARADRLHHEAREPELKDELAVMALTARDTHACLSGGAPRDGEALDDIELVLGGLLKRLDALQAAMRGSSDASA